MLVSKKDNLVGKVIAAKLISGEEIMAKVISIDNSIVSLSRPVSYVMGVQSEKSKQGNVMFAPWMLGVEIKTVIEINNNHILFMAPAGADAALKYKEAVGDSTVKDIRDNITPINR